MHERSDRMEEVKGSSDRSFGLTMAVVGGMVALWPLVGGRAPRWWLLACAVALAVLAVAVPRLLGPLNRIWLRIGLLLNRIVSPIVLGFIFYGVIAPLGLAMRVGGRNPLRLRFDKTASTYWIAREPPGPAPRSMSRQF